MALRIGFAAWSVFAASCAAAPTEAPPPAAAPVASAPAPAPAPPTNAPEPATEPKSTDRPAAKTHAHAAPHGGTLVELGDEFAHLELLLDKETGRVTAFALDGEAEKPVRLSQPAVTLRITVPDVLEPLDVELTAVENALTGEKAGDTSQFSATVPPLKGRDEFRGTITSIGIRGRSFARVAFRHPSAGH